MDLIVQSHAKIISLDIYVKNHMTVRRMKPAIDTSAVWQLASYILKWHVFIVRNTHSRKTDSKKQSCHDLFKFFKKFYIKNKYLDFYALIILI